MKASGHVMNKKYNELFQSKKDERREHFGGKVKYLEPNRCRSLANLLSFVFHSIESRLLLILLYITPSELRLNILIQFNTIRKDTILSD